MLHIVILNAGKGRRLIPLTNKVPKCLLKIGGKTILEHQISLFKELPSCKFTICVGYKKELIIDELEKDKSKYNLIYKTAVNPYFETTNTLHSLYLSVKNLEEDLLVVNGDIMIDKGIIKHFLNKIHNRENLLLTQFKVADAEAVRISLDTDRFVKEISKKISINKSVGEYTGIGYFSKHDIKHLVRSLAKGVRNNMKMEYYEWAVQNMINTYGTKIQVLNTGKYNFIEIDTLQDYQSAKSKFE